MLASAMARVAALRRGPSLTLGTGALRAVERHGKHGSRRTHAPLAPTTLNCTLSANPAAPAAALRSLAAPRAAGPRGASSGTDDDTAAAAAGESPEGAQPPLRTAWDAAEEKPTQRQASAFAKAVAILQRSQKTRRELETRLQEKGFTGEEAAHAAARCAALHLQSDADVAGSVARAKWHGARWSRWRIAGALRRRGVAAADADAALDDVFANPDSAAWRPAAGPGAGPAEDAEEVDAHDGDDADGRLLGPLLETARRRWRRAPPAPPQQRGAGGRDATRRPRVPAACRASGRLPMEARTRRLYGWLARRGHGFALVRRVMQQLAAEDAAEAEAAEAAAAAAAEAAEAAEAAAAVQQPRGPAGARRRP